METADWEVELGLLLLFSSSVKDCFGAVDTFRLDQKYSLESENEFAIQWQWEDIPDRAVCAGICDN